MEITMAIHSNFVLDTHNVSGEDDSQQICQHENMQLTTRQGPPIGVRTKSKWEPRRTAASHAIAKPLEESEACRRVQQLHCGTDMLLGI
eukprot:10301771-Karenia_brevis.AAC.1